MGVLGVTRGYIYTGATQDYVGLHRVTWGYTRLHEAI